MFILLTLSLTVAISVFFSLFDLTYFIEFISFLNYDNLISTMAGVPVTLTEIQKQAATGNLLGDASLRKKNGPNANANLAMTLKSLDYVTFL
jgi:hypothetical protein